jgi:hypothetical protein
MSDDELIFTNFEMEEQVFIPAGDGEPAQWKPKRDLTVGEFARYVQGLKDAADQQMERTRRYVALVHEAKQRAGGRGDVPISTALNRDELAELKTLQMTLAAQEREQDRRQAAIDRDKAAGRYFVRTPPRGEPSA